MWPSPDAGPGQSPSPEQLALWRRIDSFEIDGEGTPALSLAGRLAPENGWSIGYAERVVHEYPRFVFLTMTSVAPCARPSRSIKPGNSI
jgi:hypothetical protein